MKKDTRNAHSFGQTTLKRKRKVYLWNIRNLPGGWAPEGSFKYMIADDYVPSKELPENSDYDIAGMYNKG